MIDARRWEEGGRVERPRASSKLVHPLLAFFSSSEINFLTIELETNVISVSIVPKAVPCANIGLVLKTWVNILSSLSLPYSVHLNPDN